MLRETLSALTDNIVFPFSRDSYLPPCTDRGFWENLPPETKEQILREGKEAAGRELPVLKATHYREYYRNGNRVHFEEIYFARRLHLLLLAKAYCVQPSEHFLDGVIDDLDSLCGEWSWVLPAHNGPPDNPFPPADPPRVDLFAGSTSSLAALTVHLLRDPLTKEAERLVGRVAKECRRRCLAPYMENDGHWWMGFHDFPDHGGLNNWTPWITDNFLHTLLLLESDEAVLTGGMKRAAKILIHYLDVLPADGGCDEGPSYWNHAVGSFYDCLDVLHRACGKKSELLSDPFLAKAAGYIASLHIAGDYFVNYSDCSGRLPYLPHNLIYRMGTELNDARLIGLSEILEEEKGKSGTGYEEAFSPQRLVRDLAIPRKRRKGNVEKPAREIYPLSQTAVIRRRNYTFSCKGGHNEENHNHNDVGQFIIYGSKAPLIIDPGVGDYTRETFSVKRYTIWTMQSGWHNLPTINGFDQSPGAEYRCGRFDFNNNNEAVLEIGGAYPPEAGILSYTRRFHFTDDRVEMKDSWEFRKGPGDIIWNFLSLDKPEVENGCLAIRNPEGEEISLRSAPDNTRFDVEYRAFPEDDEKMRSWKRDGLWRSRLLSTGESLETGERTFLFFLNLFDK